MTLNLTITTAYYIKYSVADCGIIDSFHIDGYVADLMVPQHRATQAKVFW